MSLPENVTRACSDVLNDLLAKDPNTVKQFFAHQIPCNQELIDHPHLIVREAENGKECYITMLGIINSLLNKIGQRRVAAVLEDESDNVLSFKPYRGGD